MSAWAKAVVVLIAMAVKKANNCKGLYGPVRRIIGAPERVWRIAAQTKDSAGTLQANAGRRARVSLSRLTTAWLLDLWNIGRNVVSPYRDREDDTSAPNSMADFEGQFQQRLTGQIARQVLCV